tara:strand:- start:1394 stop:1711 length:318 start_codon:yes stop_codon:yes gene_type:complete
MGLISMITQFPKLITQVVFDYLYNNHWLAIIPHAIAGIIGIVMAIIFYYNYPVAMVSGDYVLEGISGLWEYSKLRTILFAILILNLVVSSFFMVVQPVFMKISHD